MPKPNVVRTLAAPIKVENGPDITVLEFRQPRGSDYREWPLQPAKIGDLLTIAGRLLVDQPSSLLDRLEDDADVAFVIDMAAGFFQRVQQTGPTPSP